MKSGQKLRHLSESGQEIEFSDQGSQAYIELYSGVLAKLKKGTAYKYTCKSFVSDRVIPNAAQFQFDFAARFMHNVYGAWPPCSGSRVRLTLTHACELSFTLGFTSMAVLYLSMPV